MRGRLTTCQGDGIYEAEQDVLAFESRRRAAEVTASGRFEVKIVAVTVTRAKGDAVVVGSDGHPRPEATLNGLAWFVPPSGRRAA